jgi:4'-phosphopantetheinyl transferase
MLAVPLPAAVTTLSLSETLDEGVLDVWVSRLATLEASWFDLTVLDDDERRHAEAFTEADERERYLAAHVALRHLLGSYLQIAPQAVSYVREPCPSCGAPHGRPALLAPSSPLYFSLARSGELALIAIAPRPVGVDLEGVPQSETVAAVSALLHPAERAEITAAAPAQRTDIFTRVWTRKEAYLKGVGVGVADDLAADYLGITGRETTPAGWALFEVPVGSGYSGAVAVRL